jgi:epoxide hydrolase-like predicted phosphatase
MIKALIFDFAGVIGTDGYWVWLEEKVSDLESKKFYFKNLSEKVDKGDITNQEFIEAVAKGSNLPTEIIWKEIFKKIIINTELLNLINQLKEKYKIGLLTNYTHEWMNELFKIYKLNEYFDSIVISSVHKVIKPDRKIYQISLDLLKIKSDEAIFFDDRQKNVDGGERVGIKSFLFTTNQKFREDLENCGIIL